MQVLAMPLTSVTHPILPVGSGVFAEIPSLHLKLQQRERQSAADMGFSSVTFVDKVEDLIVVAEVANVLLRRQGPREGMSVADVVYGLMTATATRVKGIESEPASFLPELPTQSASILNVTEDEGGGWSCNNDDMYSREPFPGIHLSSVRPSVASESSYLNAVEETAHPAQPATRKELHEVAGEVTRRIQEAQRESAKTLEIMQKQMETLATNDKKHANNHGYQLPQPRAAVHFADATQNEPSPKKTSDRFQQDLRRKNLGVQRDRSSSSSHDRRPRDGYQAKDDPSKQGRFNSPRPLQPGKLRYSNKPKTEWEEMTPIMHTILALLLHVHDKASWDQEREKPCTLCKEPDHLLAHCLKIFGGIHRGIQWFGEHKAQEKYRALEEMYSEALNNKARVKPARIQFMAYCCDNHGVQDGLDLALESSDDLVNQVCQLEEDSDEWLSPDLAALTQRTLDDFASQLNYIFSEECLNRIGDDDKRAELLALMSETSLE